MVAAESEYGNVTSQIGGRYVDVVSVEHDPNVDPHDYEVSPSVAREVAKARLVIQNGLGYDQFMNTLESASPSPTRRVVDVQELLGLPDSTPNPHLWYDPKTMPAVASALGRDLSAIQPSHTAYFRSRVSHFDASLRPWLKAIAMFKASRHGTSAATTEPVANYLLQALGVHNLTPLPFQEDVMNGTDPIPQDIALEEHLLTEHKVRFLAYNQQVTDSLTHSILLSAERAGVPVVGMYETMPTPGYDYQSWMMAETKAIEKAVVSKTSTEGL